MSFVVLCGTLLRFCLTVGLTRKTQYTVSGQTAQAFQFILFRVRLLVRPKTYLVFSSITDLYANFGLYSLSKSKG